MILRRILDGWFASYPVVCCAFIAGALVMESIKPNYLLTVSVENLENPAFSFFQILFIEYLVIPPWWCVWKIYRIKKTYTQKLIWVLLAFCLAPIGVPMFYFWVMKPLWNLAEDRISNNPVVR